MLMDNVAKLFPITAIATERLHQHGNPRLVFNDQLQHDLVEIRAMISAIALGDVHDVLRGLIVAVIATIDMETGAIEMRKARRQAQALSGCGSKEAVEFRHPIVVERIQSPTEGVIVELCRSHTRRNEPIGGFILEEPGDEVEGLIDKSQPIEHHRFDGLTHREVPQFRVLLGRLIEDIANGEFVEHASDKAEVV